MKTYTWMGIMAAALLAFGTVDALAHCGHCGVGGGEKQKEEQVLCPKCGEVKGSAACCKADAVICQTCKLHKDSPGCVKACAEKKAEAEGHAHAEGEKAQ